MSDVQTTTSPSRRGSMTLSRRLVIGLVTVTAVTLVVVAGATLLALRAWMFQQIDSGLMDPKAAASTGRVDAGFLARQWSENGATVVQLARRARRTR